MVPFVSCFIDLTVNDLIMDDLGSTRTLIESLQLLDQEHASPGGLSTHFLYRLLLNIVYCVNNHLICISIRLQKARRAKHGFLPCRM